MKVFCIVLLCLMTLTQQGCTNYPLTKVFKQNKSNYSLNNSNTWRDYPDLKISLQLAQSRLINIGYVISIGSTGDSHLVTRLIIDNEQVEYYRAITGNTVYHTNSVSGWVALSQGTHDITVQYRTPGTFTVNSGADWITAQLQATY